MNIKDLMKGIQTATPQFNSIKADKTETGRKNRVKATHKTADRVKAKAATSNQMKYKK